MRRLVDVIHNVAEMTGDWTRAALPWTWASVTGIRLMWGGPRMGLHFWPTTRPKGEGSLVNYNMTRDLYRNSGENALGGSFAKPIVDLQVAFIGLPTVSTGSEATDKFLNECISTHWVDEIQQMLRDKIRDSKVIVRISKPDVLDPLMTLDEAEHCVLELLPPETVDIERNVRNKHIIERAVIRRRMIFVLDDGDPTQGQDPRVEEHDVLEIIDRQQFRYFDQNTDQWLTDLTTKNNYGFVNLYEAYNEWDSVLQGGQSDLETVIPFINAFHDVLTQGLQAHRYHSTPKVVMKLSDIAPFIKNNMPEAVNQETGEILPNAEINWRGREILMLQQDEDVSFLEATSVLGDTKVMAEFLIDCICIASQTPEWAFMRVDSGSANSDRNAQTVPFIKKIDRKRRNTVKDVQELCKMALVISGVIPVKPKVSWQMVRVDDEVVYMQAFQQLIMGLEVARERGEISDATYQNMIRQFIPLMKSNAQEFTPPEPQPVILTRLGGTDRASQQAVPQKTGTPVVGGPQGKNE
jgi:hypothetical protein